MVVLLSDCLYCLCKGQGKFINRERFIVTRNKISNNRKISLLRNIVRLLIGILWPLELTITSLY